MLLAHPELLFEPWLVQCGQEQRAGAVLPPAFSAALHLLDINAWRRQPGMHAPAFRAPMETRERVAEMQTLLRDGAAPAQMSTAE